ncbi:hypothetical protein HD554DRAFT_2037075 [Boletus coccyginus]|nr:hypothetical protein HD554DRAFT_2037075 [Boletus coccyginus]
MKFQPTAPKFCPVVHHSKKPQLWPIDIPDHGLVLDLPTGHLGCECTALDEAVWMNASAAHKTWQGGGDDDRIGGAFETHGWRRGAGVGLHAVGHCPYYECSAGHQWRWLTQSGHFLTASGLLGPSTPCISPSPGPTHWVTKVVWTSADQADWETGLARLTASAGLPLRWIENPEWKKLCDCFLPKAKIPSLKASDRYGSGLELHTIQVHDISGDPKTAEELLKQMLLAISIIETEWGATVIACTTDASGESWKARHLLQAKFPRLVIPDCLTHQWNLIVGDLFKVKDDYGKYGDMVQELITWLRSKTQVLALLHDIHTNGYNGENIGNNPSGSNTMDFSLSCIPTTPESPTHP